MKRFFIRTAGGFLLITAAAKLNSAFGAATILQLGDPILYISVKNVLWIVGMIELAIALTCFFSNRVVLQASLIAWLATSFLAYRFGLFWIDYQKPCPCL